MQGGLHRLHQIRHREPSSGGRAVLSLDSGCMWRLKNEMKKKDTAVGTALAAWLDLSLHVSKETMDDSAGATFTEIGCTPSEP